MDGKLSSSACKPAMRLAGLLTMAGLALPVAAERIEWSRIADVDAVLVRVHLVTRQELLAVARELGQRPTNRALAFSVLRHEPASGRYICDLYMPEQPRHVDDRATMSLGHELAHCLGYSHRQ